ncbi:hypothetical protein WICPIJ_007345 [Wickerhamomyces pijperi]|uniref:Uncharacterized protein n=1 Tax=Wickerhamomyces pijperi TaxID=599730 RepID=A0A9P8Q1U7_WICPI|nr:hypothetical protein WICPIJ_007345 [Wickerhamomyces pijperi]
MKNSDSNLAKNSFNSKRFLRISRQLKWERANHGTLLDLAMLYCRSVMADEEVGTSAEISGYLTFWNALWYWSKTSRVPKNSMERSLKNCWIVTGV